MNLRYRVLSALWFLALVNYLERVAIGFAGPSIMQSLNLTTGQFGIILSSFGVGYLLAQLPGGLLADRLGARVMLVVGPLLWALFTGLTGIVSSLVGLVIVRICFGFSEGLSNSSVYKTIGDTFEAKHRARALGIFSTAIPLAPAFAGAAIGALILKFGWQDMFLIMVIPSLLAAMGCYLALPAGRGSRAAQSGQAAEPAEPFIAVLRRPSLWVFSLAAFCWNIPYWGFLGWMPTYLSSAQQIDLKSIGILGSLIYIFAFVGLLVIGWLGSSTFERKCPQLVMACFIGAGLGLVLAYRGGSLTLVISGLSVAAFCMFGASGPVGKIALDLAPARHRASYVGTYNTAGHIGGALAPAVIGWLVGSTGSFAAGFAFMIVALCVAAFCFLALTMRSVAEHDEKSPQLDGLNAKPSLFGEARR